MSERGPVHRADDVGRGASRKMSGRQIGAIILVVVIVVFALANTQDATIDFVFGDITLPLFVVIAVIGLIGFGAGWLVRGHRDKR
jgi:uncharacterized integral membrane protein